MQVILTLLSFIDYIRKKSICCNLHFSIYTQTWSPLTRLPFKLLQHWTTDSHLRLVEVDNDFQVGRPVIEPIGDGRSCWSLQLWGEAGLQPLCACHHLDFLHPFFTDTKHLTAKVLHLLVIYGVEFMET